MAETDADRDSPFIMLISPKYPFSPKVASTLPPECIFTVPFSSHHVHRHRGLHIPGVSVRSTML